MELLAAVCLSHLFKKSLVYLLSTSLLHLQRCVFGVPEGAVQSARRCGFWVMWSGLCVGLAARSKTLSVLRCCVAWVCVRKDYRCVPFRLGHSQLGGKEDENVEVVSWISSCRVTSLVWPRCLKALKRMITNPLLPCWDRRLFSGWKPSSVITLNLFIQLLRLRQTGHCLVWCRTWKLLKWNIFPFWNLLTTWEVSRNNSHIPIWCLPGRLSVSEIRRTVQQLSCAVSHGDIFLVSFTSTWRWEQRAHSNNYMLT